MNVGLKILTNVSVFSSAGFIWLFYEYFIKELLVLLSGLAPQGAAMLVVLYQQRAEKGWRMTYLRFLTHCSWRHRFGQLGTKWHYSWSRFSDCQTWIFNKQDQNQAEISKTSVCQFFFIYSIPINRHVLLLPFCSHLKTSSNIKNNIFV